MDLSPLLEIPFEHWAALGDLRDAARARGMEGLMLKRADSPYLAGRPKGPWFKWKRDALTCDAVLMYAQRGHGKRSSFYSDYTFGAWRPGADGARSWCPSARPTSASPTRSSSASTSGCATTRWNASVRCARCGPGLVLEVAFDAVQPSKRHKSGLALRFPRVHRIRWGQAGRGGGSP